MARTKPKARRRPADFQLPSTATLVRIGAIVVAAVLLAALLARQALAVQARRGDPAVAARVGAGAEARLRAAMIAGLTKPTTLADPKIARDARAVLRDQPLDAPALRMLALQARASGHAAEGREYARLAEAVTRRETLTQIFLVEEAARAGNARGALDHLDMALRSTNQGRTVLFTVLGKIMADPGIRREMTRYVARRTPWLPEFLDFSVREGAASAANTARLLIEADAEKRPQLLAPIAALLLGALVDQREFALAGEIYRRARGAAPDLTGTAKMTRATFDPRFGPLSWEVVDGAASGAAVRYGADGTAEVDAFASEGEKAVVLRRTLRLRPGAYRLFERRSVASGDDSTRMAWQMSCLGKTVEPIWKGPEKPLGYRAQGSPGPRIAANCPVQLLELRANGGTGMDGVEVTIGGFDLRP
jgi:hypothetical protein